MKLLDVHSVDTETKSAWVSVSFDESEEIMQDENNVKDAFAIDYNYETGVATICNEGFPIDYALTIQEAEQLKGFVKSKTLLPI